MVRWTPTARWTVTLTASPTIIGTGTAATLTWRGFDQAEIDAKAGRGQSVLVEETWDPAWHAYENGEELPVRAANTMGFMLIDAPEGEHRIRMLFETPLENRAGQVLFILTGIVIAGLVIAGLVIRR